MSIRQIPFFTHGPGCGSRAEVEVIHQGEVVQMSPRHEAKEHPTRGCGGPCQGAGVLVWRDAEATFDAYRVQVARWLDETIFTMGLPHIDHFGRCLRKGVDDAYAEQSAWGVRRQLRDPKTKLISAIVLAVQKDFFDAVRAGRACLFHLRGLLYTMSQRITWRMATERALQLMRERLAGNVEEIENARSADPSPEEDIIAAESLLSDRRTIDAINHIISSFSPKTVIIVRSRMQDPPRSFRDIGVELGLVPGAARKRYHDALERLRRLVKSTPNGQIESPCALIDHLAVSECDRDDI